MDISETRNIFGLSDSEAFRICSFYLQWISGRLLCSAETFDDLRSALLEPVFNLQSTQALFLFFSIAVSSDVEPTCSTSNLDCGKTHSAACRCGQTRTLTAEPLLASAAFVSLRAVLCSFLHFSRSVSLSNRCVAQTLTHKGSFVNIKRCSEPRHQKLTRCETNL